MSNIVKSPTSNDIPFSDVKCYCVTCGFDGTASSGRYLEFSGNVDSNQSGFVTHVNSTIVAITFSFNTSSTTAYQIIAYNGSTETILGTVTATATRIVNSTGLSFVVVAGLEIRVKCSSGSGSRPVCALYVVT